MFATEPDRRPDDAAVPEGRSKGMIGVTTARADDSAVCETDPALGVCVGPLALVTAEAGLEPPLNGGITQRLVSVLRAAGGFEVVAPLASGWGRTGVACSK